MKIAVNTRLLLKGKLEGIGWFTNEIFKRLAEQHPEHEFHFIFDREYSSDFVFAPNVFPHVVHPQVRHPFLARIWYNYTLKYALQRINPDIFISPDCQTSLTIPHKQLVVIHDINFEHYPDDLPRAHSVYLRKFSPRWAHFATRVATVSEFSKQDIVSHYHISPEKIDVLSNGAHHMYRPLKEEEKEKARQHFSGGKPYFISIGSLHPRKNLHRLLPAFDDFVDQQHADVNLVVVGAAYWMNDDMKEAIAALRNKERVIFTHRLNIEELSLALGGALANAYISYFEGFGIPIIEAFKAGVPVMTSGTSSMPEVAGDAAVIIDPMSIPSITNGLTELWKDQSLRADLIARGFERSKHYSWDRAADAMWQSILKTVQS